jgi:hypothetical protein
MSSFLALLAKRLRLNGRKWLTRAASGFLSTQALLLSESDGAEGCIHICSYSGCLCWTVVEQNYL